MNNHFAHCKTLDELKSAYRKAVKQFHPDCGGSTADMQRINADHGSRFEELKRGYNETHADRPCTETPEEFREIIEALLKLDGLEVELCGCWLWIGGNTREHKEELKTAGCRWSNNKKMWYWHHVEEGSKWHRGKRTMSEIRTKYGSQVFTADGETTGYTRIGATA